MSNPHLRLSALALSALALAGPAAARGDEPPPRGPNPSGVVFFDESFVHSIVLTFTPGDLAALQTSAPAPRRHGPPPPGRDGPPGPPPQPPEGSPGEDDFEYVPARFTLGDHAPLRIAVRWKGNSSWHWAQRHSKKSWKVDLDREVKDQTLFLLDKLNLQNGAMDSTLMRESVAYECYRRFGVPASRTTFARVALAIGGGESRDLGVYTVVEQVDGSFLKRVFGDDRGTLVKPERMGDRMGRAGLGVEQTVQSLNVKRKGRAEDRARLAAFVSLLEADPAARADDFPERLAALLDVETFLRWWAMATLLGDVDTLAGFGHNAYLYVRPADGRVVLIPWDLNHAFGGMPMTPVAQSTDWSIEKPWTGSKRLFEHVLATPAWKQRFRALLAEAMDGPFSPQAVRAAVERRATALRPGFAEPEAGLTRERWEQALAHDVERGRPGGAREPRVEPRPGPAEPAGAPVHREGDGAAPPPGAPFAGAEPGLLSFVERRCVSVRAQLAGERAGAVIEGGPGGRPPRPPAGPRPGGTRAPKPPGEGAR